MRTQIVANHIFPFCLDEVLNCAIWPSSTYLKEIRYARLEIIQFCTVEISTIFEMITNFNFFSFFFFCKYENILEINFKIEIFVTIKL